MRPHPHHEPTAGASTGATLAALSVVCLPMLVGCHVAALLAGGSPAPVPEEVAEEDPTPGQEASAVVVKTRPVSRWDRPPPAGGMPSVAVGPAQDPSLGPSLARRLERRERAAPEAPPAAPPPTASDDPLGYAQPVTGCFEGTAYLLPARTLELPSRYDRLPIAGKLWACEWNAFLHVRHLGLPDDPERREWFAIRYVGAFHVRRAGTYGFRISSDDGVRLTIDDEAVVEDERLHAMRDSDGELPLEAGDHTLVLEYYQGPNEVNLQVWVTPPDGEEGLLSVRPP